MLVSADKGDQRDFLAEMGLGHQLAPGVAQLNSRAIKIFRRDLLKLPRFADELNQRKGAAMLEWILLFLVIAAVAGVLGLPRLAGASATVAQVLIFAVLAIMLVYLVVGLVAVA
jgi:uncharacterized membrane protein YtjA (UPF0391 family)